ncbi:MAG: HEAT repeat domain-containing protein [Caldisericota bacterium]|nr:HEAT repeat domain-containing protein [Acidobacteriota bacterium]MEA3313375.1 HEAT repeat domain-containing protein [Caldisericota bacterium]
MIPPDILVIYSLIILLLFSIALFIFIVLRRIILRHLEIRFKKRYEEIEKDILKAISSLKPEYSVKVAHKYKSYPDVLGKVITDYVEIIKGQGTEQLNIIFNHGLKEKCIKDIYSRRVLKRLRATRLLVYFAGPSENAHILKLLNDKPIVRLTAINALSRAPTTDALSSIFQTFENDPDPNLNTYLNIMSGLGEKAEYFIKDCLKKHLSIEKLGMLIELIGTIPLKSLYKDIIAFSDHPDKEIRIRVAKALGNLLIPDSVDILLRLSSDSEWEVKAQAIKSLGNLRSPAALDTLTNGLFSPFWHVRFNSGYGLANMGPQGIRRLKQVSKQKKDRYASEMATMVLNDIIYTEET